MTNANRERLALMLISLIAIVMLLGFGVRALADGQIMYVAVELGSVLNVRTSPSKDADVYLRLERGEAVEITDTQGSWSAVSIRGEWGWCKTEYLSAIKLSNDVETAMVCSDGRVALRDNPDGNRVRWLQNGDIDPRPALYPSQRRPYGGKEVSVIKADLSLAYLDANIREGCEDFSLSGFV